MAIHHAVAKRAQKAGIILEESEDRTYRAHWPKNNKVLIGENAKYLLDDMLTVINIVEDWASMKLEMLEDQQTIRITLRETGLKFEGRPQVAFQNAKQSWQEARADLDEDDDEADEESLAESEEAKAEEIDEDKPEGSGSVVKQKYRLRYREHGRKGVGSGDWLDETLTNLCTNDAGINIELFESICLLNGVDLSKYRHDGHGWQGRLRMTGRNLLAKNVYFSRELIVPISMGVGEPISETEARILAPQEWLDTKSYKQGKTSPAEAQPDQVEEEAA